MDIKAIVCRLAAPQYRLGLCVCFGSLGGEGIMCGVEGLQAAGLAMLAVSFWHGASFYYGQHRDEEAATSAENLELLGQALLDSEKKQKECLELGNKYLYGLGTVRDFQKAFDCFYEGAKLGSACCATIVGSFYEQGRCKPRNMFLARYWFERGAMGGDPKAALRLAVYYSTRSDAAFKGRLAHFLCIACSAGLEEAVRLRTRLEAIGAPALREQLPASGEAVELYDYGSREELKHYIYKGGTCSPRIIKAALKELGFKLDDFKDFDFSEASLRPAYLRRMHALHPDANGGDESHAEEIERLRQAYRLLVKLGG